MLHSLKIASTALALMAGLAFAGAAFAQDRAPTGTMGSDHMTSSSTPSDHMSSGSTTSDHMAAAPSLAKAKKTGHSADAMASDHMSNSQH